MIEYLLVRCFQCERFQVDQRKQAGKWNCRICGARQSYTRVFAASNQASKLRPLVQKYNLDASVQSDSTKRCRSSPRATSEGTCEHDHAKLQGASDDSDSTKSSEGDGAVIRPRAENRAREAARFVAQSITRDEAYFRELQRATSHEHPHRFIQEQSATVEPLEDPVLYDQSSSVVGVDVSRRTVLGNPANKRAGEEIDESVEGARPKQRPRIPAGRPLLYPESSSSSDTSDD